MNDTNVVRTAQRQVVKTALQLVRRIAPLAPIPAPTPDIIIIPGHTEPPPPLPLLIPEPKPRKTLAHFLRVGATYHPRCRNAFVEKVQIGYYAYERREEWRTCLLAAAYAGAFGPNSIERPQFSYTQAVFLLSEEVGYSLKTVVTDPTGNSGPLADRIIKLADDHFWDENGVAKWLDRIEPLLQSQAPQILPLAVP